LGQTFELVASIF